MPHRISDEQPEFEDEQPLVEFEPGEDEPVVVDERKQDDTGMSEHRRAFLAGEMRWRDYCVAENAAS